MLMTHSTADEAATSESCCVLWKRFNNQIFFRKQFVHFLVQLSVEIFTNFFFTLSSFMWYNVVKCGGVAGWDGQMLPVRGAAY